MNNSSVKREKRNRIFDYNHATNSFSDNSLDYPEIKVAPVRGSISTAIPEVDNRPLSKKPFTLWNVTQDFSDESSLLEYLAKKEQEKRDYLVLQYQREFDTIILQDEFIDGEISQSERYTIEMYNKGLIGYVLDAMMQEYASNYDNEHILEGILSVVSSVPYDVVAPKGQTMAVALLSHKSLAVRDKAIQCFEKWNSKKGLIFLKSINCTPRWLQQYVEKVIMYIERDGVD